MPGRQVSTVNHSEQHSRALNLGFAHVVPSRHLAPREPADTIAEDLRSESVDAFDRTNEASVSRNFRRCRVNAQ